MAIDQNKPLTEQGPFDIVLHKVCIDFGDHILRIFLHLYLGTNVSFSNTAIGEGVVPDSGG